jgi:hypothetical protein
VAGGDLPLTWSHHDGLAASAPAAPACRLHIDDHDDMMIQIAIFAFNSPLIHQKNDFSLITFQSDVPAEQYH